MSTMCAIYTRLSKEDEERQRLGSESIQNQRALLTAYAAEHGWDIYEVYCDEDRSGADPLRPDFNRMIQAAREKKFQIVLCKTQSRFTRDMELVEKYIHGLFPLWGIRFVAVADNADTDVAGNKKARQINGLVNEWYLEDLSENIRMVLDMKRRRGQYIGGCPIYGYRKDPADKNKLVVDPEAAGVVRQIFRWALEGHGKQSIAHLLNQRGIANPTRYKRERGWDSGHPQKNDLGLWSKTTVWRILRNEMYTGVMVQGRRKKVSYKSKAVVAAPKDQWFRVEGTHEAIVERELFLAVQREMDLRARADGTGEVYPLAGLVKCRDCGSAMSRCSRTRADGTRRSYLRCQLYVDSGKQRLCTRHSVRLDELVALLSARIRHYVQSYCDLGELDGKAWRDGRTEALTAERRAVAAQTERRGRALKSLYLDKMSGVLDEGQFAELSRAFREEKDNLERRLTQLEAELAEQTAPDRQRGRTAGARGLLELDPVPRELAVMLIREVRIGERDPETGRQDVEICWRF